MSEKIFGLEMAYVDLFSISMDSYQDTHTQSFVMVTASGRWFGVRLDAIISLLIGLVVSVVVLVSQDADM